MATLTEVSAQPVSGLTTIDALLGRLPGWNWLAPTRTELRYTYALTPGDSDLTPAELTGGLVAFNVAQQAAVTTALAHPASITSVVGDRYRQGGNACSRATAVTGHTVALRSPLLG